MAKRQVKKSSKRKVTDLSSDELLEQIINKKKSKKSTNYSSASKSVNNKKNVSLINDKKNELTNDEIYEKIVAKRKQKTQKKKITADNIELPKKKIDTKSSGEIDKKVENDKDNLIITREIRYDEDFDLNNKKNLKKLREAIEEFDKLEKLEEEKDKEKSEKEQILVDNVDVVEEIKIKKRVDKYKDLDKKVDYKDNEKIKVPKKHRNKNIKKNILIFLLILIILLGVLSCILYNRFNKGDNNLDVLDPFKIKEEEEKERQELLNKYNECLRRPVDENNIPESVTAAMNDLTTYLEENYETSIKYEDLTTGFIYTYNPNIVYYAASTIKSLDALYIYTKAAEGKIDLDETMTYTSKYKWGSSKEMSKLSYGTKVTIRDLVKYAITVSDNSAHQMLISYIGRSNLKEFGNSLGAKNTLIGSDNFGNIDVNDAIIYMKAINNFINSNEVLGSELKEYFLTAEQNDLELPDFGISAIHKYGQYSSYYHDIGVVYDENPYVVAILTLEGGSNFENKVKDINSHIYEMHKIYNDNKKKLCNIEVYGE